LRRLVKEALRMRPSRIMGLVIAGMETSAEDARPCAVADRTRLRGPRRLGPWRRRRAFPRGLGRRRPERPGRRRHASGFETGI